MALARKGTGMSELVETLRGMADMLDGPQNAENEEEYVNPRGILLVLPDAGPVFRPPGVGSFNMTS